MKDIAIFGAGGFGREVKLIIDAINHKNPNTYNFIGFYDDNIAKGKIVNGFSILGGIDDLNKYPNSLSVVVSLGTPKVKRTVLNRINNDKIEYPNIIHPNSSISEDLKIGQGVIICEGCIITCNVDIKDFVILNLMCTIGHDTIIDSYTAIMPSVNVSGEVYVNEEVYIGTGAIVINQIKIGANVIVGAGAVIIRDVPDGATVVGNPGKVIALKN